MKIFKKWLTESVEQATGYNILIKSQFYLNYSIYA